jgi:hypothetical protein
MVRGYASGYGYDKKSAAAEAASHLLGQMGIERRDSKPEFDWFLDAARYRRQHVGDRVAGRGLHRTAGDVVMTHTVPWKPVNCQYGAPMGRRCAILDETEKHYLRRVPMSPCRAYDIGGAYWGCCDYRFEICPLIAYGMRTATRPTSVKSREDAKARIREEYPDIQFYR